VTPATSTRVVFKGRFRSARGIEKKKLDTRHSAGKSTREICADDLRRDGRYLALRLQQPVPGTSDQTRQHRYYLGNANPQIEMIEPPQGCISIATARM
jgi:hypothetical protein